MATKTWTGIFGGNWSDPTEWSSGEVPAAGDTVTLSAALNGPYTVHLDANEGAYAALMISTANATLALYTGGLTLSVTGATTLSAGGAAIAGNAALDTGTFQETGRALQSSGNALCRLTDTIRRQPRHVWWHAFHRRTGRFPRRDQSVLYRLGL